MIGIDSVVVTDELISEQFVCNLDKCKGACCIEGDSGAPLNEDELGVLEEIYPKVKPYMTEKGIATIEKQGTWVMDVDGDLTTPCVDTNKECAYVIWEKGITQCAIEKPIMMVKSVIKNRSLVIYIRYALPSIPNSRS